MLVLDKNFISLKTWWALHFIVNLSVVGGEEHLSEKEGTLVMIARKMQSLVCELMKQLEWKSVVDS